MMELKRFGVSVPSDLLDEFDNVVERKGYVGRSEAIRDAMRLYLSQSAWESNQDGHLAALNVVYQHRPRLMSELVSAQHNSKSHVVSTMHVHLTESRCFETMMLRGKREEIQEFADRISGLSGVEHVRLFTFSIPEGDSDHHH